MKNFLTSILYKMTYSSRYKKKLDLFQIKLSNLLEMKDDEFLMEYVDVCSKYETRKVLLYTITVTLIISIIIGLWKYIFKTIYQLLLIKSNMDMVLLANNAIIAITMVGVLIVVITLLILTNLIKGLKALSKEKNLLQEVKRIRLSNEIHELHDE